MPFPKVALKALYRSAGSFIEEIRCVSMFDVLVSMARRCRYSSMLIPTYQFGRCFHIVQYYGAVSGMSLNSRNAKNTL